jgi:phage terminase large subunit GpA-like protein
MDREIWWRKKERQQDPKRFSITSTTAITLLWSTPHAPVTTSKQQTAIFHVAIQLPYESSATSETLVVLLNMGFSFIFF